MKNSKSKLNPIKTGKELGKRYCLGCKYFTNKFRPQEVKMTSKVLREKSNCVVCRNAKSRFLKQKHNKQKTIQRFTNWCYKTNMLTYCVKCRKNTENLNPKVFKTKNGRLIVQSKCTECGIKKSRFVREQEGKCLLSNIGIKTPLSEVPLLNILFQDV